MELGVDVVRVGVDVVRVMVEVVETGDVGELVQEEGKEVEAAEGIGTGEGEVGG
jgi:hypothetical protein